MYAASNVIPGNNKRCALQFSSSYSCNRIVIEDGL